MDGLWAVGRNNFLNEFVIHLMGILFVHRVIEAKRRERKSRIVMSIISYTFFVN